MSMLYHASKENIVADILNKVLMGSVAHIEDRKKELVKDVHRLAHSGVRAHVQNGLNHLL